VTQAGVIRVLMVDDHPVLREGVAGILAAEPGMTLVGEAGDGREGVEQFRRHRPDIVLMDLQMPNMTGTDAIRAIRAESPQARIIVLTISGGDAHALRAFRAGASGYLLKNAFRKELLDTIRAVHAGQKRIPPSIGAALAEHMADDMLTARELEVLVQVAGGYANKIIAAHLAITEGTVKGHMKNVLSKLGANDRTHAVTIALKRGIIEL
jgi:two-component system, NarL family, response regulator